MLPVNMLKRNKKTF